MNTKEIVRLRKETNLGIVDCQILLTQYTYEECLDIARHLNTAYAGSMEKAVVCWNNIRKQYGLPPKYNENDVSKYKR